MKPDVKRQLGQHRDLVKAISKILGGVDPSVQGSVTVELMTIYIAGYTTPEVREQVLQLQIEAIRDLLPVCAEEIHGDGQ